MSEEKKTLDTKKTLLETNATLNGYIGEEAPAHPGNLSAGDVFQALLMEELKGARVPDSWSNIAAVTPDIGNEFEAYIGQRDAVVNGTAAELAAGRASNLSYEGPGVGLASKGDDPQPEYETPSLS